MGTKIMKAVTSLKVKNENGEFSDIPIAVRMENVKIDSKKNLKNSGVFLDTDSENIEVVTSKTPVYQEDVIDNLLSTSTITPLSGKQGKILNERINMLSTFDGNPSDLEIADLRVGADGKTYSSAGMAVRENFNILRNKDLQTKENVSNKVKGRTQKGGYIVAPSNAPYPSVEYLEDHLGKNYYTSTKVDELIEQAKASATEWKELTDLRLGADGNYYATAGDAVRQSIKKIQTDLENKISLLTSDKTMLFDEDFNLLAEPINVTKFLEGGFAAAVGAENALKIKYAFISSQVISLSSKVDEGCSGLTYVYINNLKEKINLDLSAFSISSAKVLYLDEISLDEDILDILPLFKIYVQLEQSYRKKIDKSNSILTLNSEKELIAVSQVTEIPSNFWGGDYATEVIYIGIPSSVTTIKKNAFIDCINLTDIYIDNYQNNITIESGAFPSNVSIYWETSLNEIDIINNTLLEKADIDYVVSQLIQIKELLNTEVKDIKTELDKKISSKSTFNLLNLGEIPELTYGLTVTKDSNNHITIVGTSTTNGYIHIPIKDFSLKANTKYCLTATNLNSNTSNVILSIRVDQNGNKVTASDTKLSIIAETTDATKTIVISNGEEEYNNCYFGIYVGGNLEISKEFDIQLEEGETFTHFIPPQVGTDYIESYSTQETDEKVSNLQQQIDELNIEIDNLQNQINESNTEIDNLNEGKATVVQSEGSLTLIKGEDEVIDAKADFISTKIDNIVTIAINATLPAGLNLVKFRGLPYLSYLPEVGLEEDETPTSKSVNIMTFSEQGKLIRIRIKDNTILIRALDSDKIVNSSTFVEGDSLTIHTTYIVKS